MNLWKLYDLEIYLQTIVMSARVTHKPLPNLFTSKPHLIEASPLFDRSNLSKPLLYSTIEWNLSQESCIDCRANNGTCSIHSVGGWLVTAADIMVAAKRAQWNNWDKLSPEFSREYNDMIHAVYREFYRNYYGRTHTHRSELLDESLLNQTNLTKYESQIREHIWVTISCGAMGKVLLDALDFEEYGLKYHVSDLPLLVRMYNYSIQMGCFDLVDNRAQEAWHIFLQYCPELHETLFDANSAKKAVANLNDKSHQSVINTQIGKDSAFVYDYDASYLNGIKHLYAFIHFLRSKNNSMYDALVEKIAYLHGLWTESTRDEIYEKYESILIWKFRKQRLRSDQNIVKQIPNAVSLLSTHSPMDPKLVSFKLN